MIESENKLRKETNQPTVEEELKAISEGTEPMTRAKIEQWAQDGKLLWQRPKR